MCREQDILMCNDPGIYLKLFKPVDAVFKGHEDMEYFFSSLFIFCIIKADPVQHLL